MFWPSQTQILYLHWFKSPLQIKLQKNKIICISYTLLSRDWCEAQIQTRELAESWFFKKKWKSRGDHQWNLSQQHHKKDERDAHAYKQRRASKRCAVILSVSTFGHFITKKKKENQPSRPTSSEKREKGKEVRGEGEVDWRGTNRYQ